MHNSGDLTETVLGKPTKKMKNCENQKGKIYKERSGEKKFKHNINKPAATLEARKKIIDTEAKKNHENAVLKISAQNLPPKQCMRRAAKRTLPVMIYRCLTDAGDSKFLVRASGIILCVRNDTNLRTPARTSSRTKYCLMSM